MEWAEWESTYRAILADFGWAEADDAAAAGKLREVLSGRSAWRDVGTELKHRNVAIIGCGPQLANMQFSDVPAGAVVVAADGATARLRELGIVPRVVVTDLDGDEAALRWAAEQGSSIVVHAHGANQDRLDLAAELGPFVAGTYQSAPVPGLAPLRNLGGFTDGDRAVLLCESFHARSIHLVAFDANAPPSRYTGDFNPETKPRKLAWMARILDDAAKRVPMSGSWRAAPN